MKSSSLTAKHKKEWLPKLMKLVAVTRGGESAGRTGLAEPLLPAALAVVGEVAPELLQEEGDAFLRVKLGAERTLRASDLWQMWCMLSFAMRDGDIEMFEKLCDVQPKKELRSE